MEYTWQNVSSDCNCDAFNVPAKCDVLSYNDSLAGFDAIADYNQNGYEATVETMTSLRVNKSNELDYQCTSCIKQNNPLLYRQASSPP